MATTPNFNWSTPDNTGLVKNGALDIRTLGNSIDASMADLKGGTTGQVLAKATNTDMDFTWVAQDDSNAIQNAIVDAKGDLIAATAADTPARLAVGTNGQVLTADSTAATGLKWAAAATQAMTLISSTTFSNQATQAFDGVFSSTYKSYIIDFQEIYSSIANATIRFQWRYAGPTTQAASYYGGFTGGSTTGSNFAGGGIANGSFLQISTAVGNNDGQCMRGSLSVFGCSGTSKNPTANYQTTTMYDGTTANGGGWINAANTYTGFIISGSTGNLTGTVSIYGVA